MKRVGVLALQGCVEPHRRHIEALGAEYIEVRTAAELAAVDRLILPGGESTAILRLLEVFELDLRELSIPVWGICAGAILLARFQAIEITVERNAYGRQQASFEGEHGPFIRAPRILSVGSQVKVLARERGDPVWVQQGPVMATTFHPELGSQAPSPMHRRFLGGS